jgi:hypothetical protein
MEAGEYGLRAKKKEELCPTVEEKAAKCAAGGSKSIKRWSEI